VRLAPSLLEPVGLIADELYLAEIRRAQAALHPVVQIVDVQGLNPSY